MGLLNRGEWAIATAYAVFSVVCGVAALWAAIRSRARRAAEVSSEVIGIIGGIGPESTIAYYRLILDAYRRRAADRGHPALIINSIDMTAMLDLVEPNKLEELTAWLSAEIERLYRAGSSVALIAANTPHIVFDRVAGTSRIPLVSMTTDST